MKKLLTLNKNELGSSTLLLVLIVAVVITILSNSILMFTLFSRKVSQTGISKNNSLYLAESTVYNTAQNLTNQSYVNTLTFPFEEIIQMDKNSRVYKKITFDEGVYTIEVISEVSGANRRLIAKFGPAGTSSRPIDVVLVIDNSGSMGGDIDEAKLAVTTFIETLIDNSVDYRAGIVVFNKEVDDKYTTQLTNFAPLLYNTVNSIKTDGGTNLDVGVAEAITMLETTARLNANKVIVMITDGVSDSTTTYKKDQCGDNQCMRPNNTSFAPDNHGTICTQQMIDRTNQLQVSPYDYTFFSISLTSNYKDFDDHCEDEWGSKEAAREKVIELANLTLLRMSNEPNGVPLPNENDNYTYFKETADPSKLKEIYQEIATDISGEGFFRYEEVEPLPIPEI